MMKKNNITKFICVFALLLFLFTFVGCGETPKDETKKEDNYTESDLIKTTEKLYLKLDQEYEISYTLKEGSEVNAEFTSSNADVAYVDEIGTIYANQYGESNVTINIELDSGEKIKKTIQVVVYKYIISFQLAGGKCEVNCGYASDGGSFTLPTPTKDKAEFLGWTIKGDTGAGYVTELTNIQNNITVTANWVSYYTIKFELSGGTYEDGSDKLVRQGDNVELGTPRKDGNKFLGWGLSKTSSSYISKLTSVNSNCTVYAIWEPVQIQINFDANGGTYNGNKYVVYDDTLNLGIPHKFGFTFLGWTTEKDSTSYITKLEHVTKETTLYAHWEENPSAIDFMVSNLPVDGIEYLQTLKLNVAYSQTSLKTGTLSYKSSNEKIFTVTSDGTITAKKVGVARLTVTLNASVTLTEEIEIVVYVPGYFYVQYDTTSYVTVNDTIKLKATYYDRNGVDQPVSFKSLSTAVANVDNNGAVKGVKTGNATIRAFLTSDETKYFDFNVTVIDSSLSAVMKFVLNSHESNIFTRYDLGIGAGTPVYDADIIGSVSDILFNDDLTINRKYEDVIKKNSNYGGAMTRVEFVCVHYTGNMASGANANANASYFASTTSSSIHYTTGNDGVYSVLADNVVGWHAGDGTKVYFNWYATGVKVGANDPQYPVFGINADSKFTINGQDTKISVPEGTTEATKRVTSNTFIYNGKTQNCINDMGLPFTIKNGEYYMGTTYWCYSQVAAGRICSHGGNNNSIGIESCVNQGSDLWYTWQKTAQLVAQLMKDNNLDITRVVGHHFFTAKDCPQPLLENDLEIWWKFKEMVEAEYEKLTKYSDCTFKFEIISGDATKTGRTNQAGGAQTITYKVTVTKGTKSESIILSSVLNGVYSK